MYRVGASTLAAFSLLISADGAAGFTGEYASEDADVTLVLVRELDGSYEGTWVEGGRTFYVEGELEGGRLLADCFTADTDVEEERFLAVVPGDGGLLARIMPPDDDDEPDWSRVQEHRLFPTGVTDARSTTAYATPARPGPHDAGEVESLAGVYTGTVGGLPATLTITEEGAIGGRLVWAGNEYVLIGGREEDGGASGEFVAALSGDVIAWELAHGDIGDTGELALVLALPAEASGDSRQVATLFQRSGTTTQADPENPTPSVAVGDPRLVGRWVKSESMTSGDLSMASQATFLIAPDGTFAAGGAELVGGGSLGSFDSGPAEEVITGQWMTQGQIFYIRNATSPGWVPFARYHIEGMSLIFIFGDGTRDLWRRT